VVVHTIGHSTLVAEQLVDLLRVHGIRGVGDVRRHPGSRRHPHFSREALAARLGAEGIRYDWLPELGGRRTPRPDSPHVAWRNTQFRGYADHMSTPEFTAGLDRLRKLAADRPTAILCAEAVPWRCHRQLIADALVAAGHEVRHVLSSTTSQAHRLNPLARRDGDWLVYDLGHLPLGR